jgi:methyl-accepting chemotaxis protein
MNRKTEEEKPQTNTASSRLVTLWQGLDAAGIMNLTFELDAIGLLVDASESFLKLLGCPNVLELIGHPFSDLMLNRADESAFGDAVHKALMGHPSSLRCSVHYQGEPKAMLKVVLSSMQTEEDQTRVLCCAANISVREAKLSDAQAQLAVIHDIYATAELTLDGRFLDANVQFCRMTGMSREALLRTTHAELCESPDEPNSSHRQLWRQVNSGAAVTGEYKRYRADGSPFWIWASYNPIVDLYGKAHKVVLYAKDITSDKTHQADISGKINAIHRSTAMIEFSTQGRILDVNENFLRLFDYQRDDVVGKHHRMFCDTAEAQSANYLAFWEDLGKGTFAAGEFKRLGRGGREVWIQASYNPIYDEDGKVCKVVKIAMDVTSTKQRNAEYQSLVEALDRIQLMVEFDLSGHILRTNSAFANLMGYNVDELSGLHHRALCPADFVANPGYQLLWNRLTQGRHESGEFKRQTKDGRSIWQGISSVPTMCL